MKAFINKYEVRMNYNKSFTNTDMNAYSLKIELAQPNENLFNSLIGIFAAAKKNTDASHFNNQMSIYVFMCTKLAAIDILRKYGYKVVELEPDWEV